MNVLLTGGAGYIGSHVANNLIDAGHSVHIVDNLITGNKNLIPKEAIFTNCNINDSVKIDKILNENKFDLLMHFAGYIQVEESVGLPSKYFENNTLNSIKLFKTCKKNNLNKILFSSTASIYGNKTNSGTVSETDPPDPQNPYAESKLRTENFLRDNQNDYQFIILRYFNVAGADKKLRTGQISKKSTHLIKILSEIAIGKKAYLEVYGNDYNTHDGTAIRDYIHVTDLADIHIEVSKYLLNNSKSEIFNCGYGVGYSVLEVIRETNKICNGSINYKFADRRKGDAQKLVSDISKIKRSINWEPKFNNLNKIINSSIIWEKELNEKNF